MGRTEARGGNNHTLNVEGNKKAKQTQHITLTNTNQRTTTYESHLPQHHMDKHIGRYSSLVHSATASHCQLPYVHLDQRGPRRSSKVRCDAIQSDTKRYKANKKTPRPQRIMMSLHPEPNSQTLHPKQHNTPPDDATAQRHNITAPHNSDTIHSSPTSHNSSIIHFSKCEWMRQEVPKGERPS